MERKNKIYNLKNSILKGNDKHSKEKGEAIQQQCKQ